MIFTLFESILESSDLKNSDFLTNLDQMRGHFVGIVKHVLENNPSDFSQKIKEKSPNTSDIQGIFRQISLEQILKIQMLFSYIQLNDLQKPGDILEFFTRKAMGMGKISEKYSLMELGFELLHKFSFLKHNPKTVSAYLLTVGNLLMDALIVQEMDWHSKYPETILEQS